MSYMQIVLGVARTIGPLIVGASLEASTHWTMLCVLCGVYLVTGPVSLAYHWRKIVPFFEDGGASATLVDNGRKNSGRKLHGGRAEARDVIVEGKEDSWEEVGRTGRVVSSNSVRSVNSRVSVDKQGVIHVST
jgi:hypothetical protein